jgi:uncharacterized damage-inducible protein DinB
MADILAAEPPHFNGDAIPEIFPNLGITVDGYVFTAQSGAHRPHRRTAIRVGWSLVGTIGSDARQCDMNTLYRFDDPRLLAGILDGEGTYLRPAAVLEGLSEEQVHVKPHGLPHSIAEIVAHMCYWQEWFNGCAEAGFAGVPEHAVEGWPVPSSGGWAALRERYLRAIETAKRIAAKSDSLNEALLPSEIQVPPLAKESRGSGILHGAVHGSHHLGQIITMRQLMGLWPPPAGSMTW